jgi:hypothetical protein
MQEGMFCCSHSTYREQRPRSVATADPTMRVGQVERDAVIEQLGRHTADGRLTLVEFEERVEEALGAKTRGELDLVLRELPRLDRERAERDARRGVRSRHHEHRGFAPTPTLLLVAVIAIAVVAGAPWLLWSLFWLVPAVLNA